VIDLPTLQRYLNFHYSVTIDLFGADQSSNAATFYSSGLKGRFNEAKREDDHRLGDRSYPITEVDASRFVEREVPMLNALNEVLRDDFIRDSLRGIGRWNKVIESHGLPFRLVAPHKAFNRKIGSLAGFAVTPTGSIVDPETWRAGAIGWLPSASDREFVLSLMHRTTEPGKFASFIAPPVAGINRQPLDFPYVRCN